MSPFYWPSSLRGVMIRTFVFLPSPRRKLRVWMLRLYGWKMLQVRDAIL